MQAHSNNFFELLNSQERTTVRMSNFFQTFNCVLSKFVKSYCIELVIFVNRAGFVLRRALGIIGTFDSSER